MMIQTPPAWTDRDDCFRCHTSFSAFTRKHHCRACGETFCSACSSKQTPLLEYGIEDDVRVCVTCYDRLTTTGSVLRHHLSVEKPEKKSQAELDEEDALQLALILSQSEAEESDRQKKLATRRYAPVAISLPTIPTGSVPMANAKDVQTTVNPIHNYWETQTKEDLITIKPLPPDPLNKYVRDDEIDGFAYSVTDQINNMKFRMLSNEQRGRNIATDTAVQSMFIVLQRMYPELHRFLRSLDEKQAYYETLQDKLNQLKDAREALNALREEHLDQKQRQAVERERQRQLQLAIKLDDMRQKKQAYLEYQRQIHLRRLAEQEAEMQARLDQQRRYAQQREQHNQMPFVPVQSPPYYSPHPSHYPMAPMPNVVPPSMAYNAHPYPPSTTPTPSDQKLFLLD